MTTCIHASLSASPATDEILHHNHHHSHSTTSCREGSFASINGNGASISHQGRSRLAFVYGTLKKGFGNHWLMEELVGARHAQFLGPAYTSRRYPLVCGPFQVPFLLYTPSPSGHQVRGELYQIDDVALARLDELEGLTKGHYERKPLDVVLKLQFPNQEDPDHVQLHAEAYFASSAYGQAMAACAEHIPSYTETEAATYVRRKDRPQNRTFLEHVYAWIEESRLSKRESLVSA